VSYLFIDGDHVVDLVVIRDIRVIRTAFLAYSVAARAPFLQQTLHHFAVSLRFQRVILRAVELA